MFPAKHHSRFGGNARGTPVGYQGPVAVDILPEEFPGAPSSAGIYAEASVVKAAESNGQREDSGCGSSMEDGLVARSINGCAAIDGTIG